MKYSKEFKLEMIIKRKNNEYIPAINGYSLERWHHKNREWERVYDYLGEAGFEHNKPKLSIYDKITMIKRVNNGESITDVALSYGRQTDLLSKWIKMLNCKTKF